MPIAAAFRCHAAAAAGYAERALRHLRAATSCRQHAVDCFLRFDAYCLRFRYFDAAAIDAAAAADIFRCRCRYASSLRSCFVCRFCHYADVYYCAATLCRRHADAASPC